MIFVKVDVTLFKHYRVLELEPSLCAACMGVWLAALCYTREHNLDGFCPIVAIREIVTDKIIDELVRVGLIARDEHNGRHGITILNYEKHNETRSEIEKRLKRDRVRKKSERNPGGRQGSVRTESERNPKLSDRIPSDGVAGIPDSDSDSVSSSSLSSSESLSLTAVSDQKAESIPRPAAQAPVAKGRMYLNAMDDGCMGMAVEAWREGIQEARGGKPFPKPTGGDLAALLEAFDLYCPNVAIRVDWARSEAKLYGCSNPGRTLSAKWFGTWIGSGSPIAQQPKPKEPERISNAEQGERDRKYREARLPGESWESVVKRIDAAERQKGPPHA